MNVNCFGKTVLNITHSSGVRSCNAIHKNGAQLPLPDLRSGENEQNRDRKRSISEVYLRMIKVSYDEHDFIVN